MKDDLEYRSNEQGTKGAGLGMTWLKVKECKQ